MDALEDVRRLIRSDEFLEADSRLWRARGTHADSAAWVNLSQELIGRMKETAEVLAIREDLNAARLFIQRILKRFPGDYEMSLLEGRIARKRHAFKAASAEFRRARELKPTDIRAYIHGAETLAQLGRSADALELLRAALRNCARPGSGDVGGLLDHFRAALYGCNFISASAIGEEILDASSRMQDLRALGWACLVYDFRSQDQPRGLIDLLLRRLAVSPVMRRRAPWGLYWRLYFERVNGGSGEVSPLSKRLSKMAGRYDWMRYELGKCLFEAGKFAAAAAEFEAAAACSRPPGWRSLCFRAESLWCLGNWDGALKDFARAERLVTEQDRSGMRTWKGEVLIMAGEYAQGLELVRESIRDKPCDAHFWEGAALSLLGRFGEALVSLDKAIAINPARVEARLCRAETLLGLSRPRQALVEIGQAFRRLPDRGPDSRNFYCHVVRGLARAALNDRAGALRDYRAVPAQVRDFADREGAEGSAGLKRILELSRGVRRDLYAPSWMRGRVLSRASKASTRFSRRVKRSPS